MTVNTALLDKLALHAPHLSSRQVIPAFLYGTAWKKEATGELVFRALSNGFTGVDTACQPKHYREDLVSDGLRQGMAHNSLRRSDMYIQTKFTPVSGQDPNQIPYDPEESIAEQVKQSVTLSLARFDVSDLDESSESYLDTVVLHSPMRNINETMEVWTTLEKYVPRRIRNLGISNCDLVTLKNVYDRAIIKPSVVQNRFYPRTEFDTGVRRYCCDNNIVYQSFWTLSANPELLCSRPVQDLALQLRIGRESALYCLVLGLGNTVVLNGTTKEQHMQEDMAALAAARNLCLSDSDCWEGIMEEFRKAIGESQGG